MLPVFLLLLSVIELSQGRGTETRHTLSTNCQLKLLCASLETEDSEGGAGPECQSAGAQCRHSVADLLEASSLGPLARRRSLSRGRRSVFGLPPAITITGQDPRCRQCERKGALCLAFSLGSFKGCAGATLLGGPLGQLCNVVALPVRLVCTANSIKCYKEGCGLLRIPNIDLPFRRRS